MATSSTGGAPSRLAEVRSAVAVMASCDDLLAAPSLSSSALRNLSLQLASPVRPGVHYRGHVVLDDRRCPQRCQEAVPAGMECHSASALADTLGATAASTEASTDADEDAVAASGAPERDSADSIKSGLGDSSERGVDDSDEHDADGGLSRSLSMKVKLRQQSSDIDELSAEEQRKERQEELRAAVRERHAEREAPAELHLHRLCRLRPALPRPYQRAGLVVQSALCAKGAPASCVSVRSCACERAIASCVSVRLRRV